MFKVLDQETILGNTQNYVLCLIVYYCLCFFSMTYIEALCQKNTICLMKSQHSA